jgi:hypothetical protein
VLSSWLKIERALLRRGESRIGRDSGGELGGSMGGSDVLVLEVEGGGRGGY